MEPRSKQITQGFISQMAVAEKRLFSPSVSSHDMSTYLMCICAEASFLCSVARIGVRVHEACGAAEPSPHRSELATCTHIIWIWMTRYSSQAPFMISLSKVGYDCFLSK